MSEASAGAPNVAQGSGADASYARYTRIAVLLHWVIAAAILFQIWSGWSAHEAFEEGATASADEITQAATLLQTHKSIGLIVLVLSLFRLAWRLGHKTPPLPAGTPGLVKFLSEATHVLLYAAMIAVPLSGWVYASASGLQIEQSWIKLFEAPLITPIEGLGEETKADLAGFSGEAHGLMAWAMALLVLAHIGAALKHHFVDKDAVLARMTPGVKPAGGVIGAPISGVISLVRRLGALGIAAVAVIIIVAIFFAINRADEIEGGGDAGGRSYDADVNGGFSGGAAAPTPAQTTVQRWTPVYEESSVVLDLAIRTNSADVTLPWTGAIAFDPADIAGSSVSIEFDMAAATTAYQIAQSNMMSAAWLDAANHPTATFTADSFESADGENAYIANGALTVRGVSQPVTLAFTLDIDGDRAVMNGSATINRLDFGVGRGQESADVPPVEFEVIVNVVANRAE